MTDQSRTHRTLSRHLTSEGVVVWSRCACGRLRMDLVPHAAGRPISAGPCARCHALR
ncbi:hypothetical protein AGRA3207_001330 [Actinomadura graeca]|uniref:Uncharacterized protein n=1 Tax=Actinomadura graeca TaxID=2750812 RepID=A0ABX8QP85_9ACTN|nr:hypothetical protein [Actinomadura graeca]QXJ20593.1 hypothetical protein AGRA3207_001330 [Actinomadura graeca]